MDRRETNHQWYESFDAKDMTFTILDADGNETFISAIYEVCNTCEGKGSHVNPSIDSNGISSEEFAEDRDFEEMYFGGAYDVTCNECHGNIVSPVVDWDRLDVDMKKYVEDMIQSHYDYQREIDNERRYGY